MPGLIADRPTEAAMTSLRVQVLIICPRSPLAGGNLLASRWRLSDGEPLEHLPVSRGCDRFAAQDACAASPGYTTSDLVNVPVTSADTKTPQYLGGLVGTGLATRPQGTLASGGDGCRRIAPLLVRHCRAEARRSACLHLTSPETTACACLPCARPRFVCGPPRGSKPICR